MAHISDWALQHLIKDFEGCSLTAYQDSSGVWTIGWGHTGNVTPGQVITQEEADKLLKADLEYYEKAVENLLPFPVTQYQFDALVSFAYNVGVAALAKSSLMGYIKAQKWFSAAEEFIQYVHDSRGVILWGLVRRRHREALRFVGAGG
jgi:lysozyme